MPLPEGYLPREGDVLIFHAKVRYQMESNDDCVHVTKPGASHTNITLPISEIVGLHYRHFEPGEVVRLIGYDASHGGEVIAVHGRAVWVKNKDGYMQTLPAHTLELASALDQPFVKPAPNHQSMQRSVSSVAEVPLGGAHLPKPFCEPPPMTPAKVMPASHDDGMPEF